MDQFASELSLQEGVEDHTVAVSSPDQVTAACRRS